VPERMVFFCGVWSDYADRECHAAPQHARDLFLVLAGGWSDKNLESWGSGTESDVVDGGKLIVGRRDRGRLFARRCGVWWRRKP
jgi:hypothetical protein